jgi:hypothetical protein
MPITPKSGSLFHAETQIVLPNNESITLGIDAIRACFSSCTRFRLYHHKEGKVVKLGDDLMSATRYAFMMRRYAQTVTSYRDFRAKIEYPRMGVA